MIEILYVVSRLCVDGIPTSKVVLNKTKTEKKGRRYARRIEHLTYGAQSWKFVGFLATERDDLDKITEIHGAHDEAIFRRTGVDVRDYIV